MRFNPESHIYGNVGKFQVPVNDLLHVLLLQVVQATLQAGFLTRISNNLSAGICDQFFLGGPLSLRGFQARGVGPHKDGNALGANVSDSCNIKVTKLSYLYA
jgi:outer membrane protein insertion porin family